MATGAPAPVAFLILLAMTINISGHLICENHRMFFLNHYLVLSGRSRHGYLASFLRAGVPGFRFLVNDQTC